MANNSKSISRTSSMSKSNSKSASVNWKGVATIGVAGVAGAGVGALAMGKWTENHQNKVVSREQVEAAKRVMAGID